MKNKYFKILILIIIVNIYNINLNAKNNFLEEIDSNQINNPPYQMTS